MLEDRASLSSPNELTSTASWLITWAAGFGLFFDAFASVIYTVTVPLVAKEFNVSTHLLAGTFGSVFLVGYTFGTILFGVLADRLGRRLTLGISIVGYGVATAATGLSSNLFFLGGLRCITGIGGAGEFSVGFPYVSEVWSRKNMARAIGFTYAFWGFGYFFTIFVFETLVPQFGWRASYFFALIPTAVILLARLRLEESPRFVHVLQALKKLDAKKTTLAQAWRVPMYRRRLTASILIASAIAYGYYALAFYLAAYVVGAYHMSPTEAGWFTMLFVAGDVCGIPIAVFCADRFGRKRSALVGCVLGMAVTFFWWQGHLSIQTFGVLEFLGSTFIGFGWTMALIVLCEIFPTEIRASAFGWSLGIGRIVSIAAPIVTQFLASYIGLEHAIQSSVLIYLCMIAGFFMLPETKTMESGEFVLSPLERAEEGAAAGASLGETRLDAR
jgi:MFS transporter, putative metabolite:H+ symporter